MLKHQICLKIALPLLAAVAAQAQQAQAQQNQDQPVRPEPALIHRTDRPPVLPQTPLQEQWPTTRIAPHQRLLIVTSAQPGTPHTCTVQSIDGDEILCAVKRGAQPVVYERPDVTAIIEPRDNPWQRWGEFAGWISVSGGIYYGVACLVALSAPYLALAIPAAFLGFTVVIGALWDLGNGPGRDWLVYQKPGETLQVQLHR